jgi:hypothetical protein
MQMKWAVEIQKFSLEQRNLKDLLSGLGFVLVDGIEYPAITSAEINSCANAKEVFEIAKHLRDTFIGPADIASTFQLGAVIDYSSTPPERCHIAEVQPVEIIVTVESVNVTIPPPEDLSGDELKKWEEEQAERDYQIKLENQRSKLEGAYRNPRAKKILELLADTNPSGETLNKIYELAEGKKSNRRAFHAQFGITKDQFDRFSDAVHNPKTTGDWARHAIDRTPNKNPMTKKEAENFIRQIADEWLRHIRTQKN